MNFEIAFEYLKSFVSYEDNVDYFYNEENFNLDKVKVFLEKYNVKYSKIKFIHVGGSKGKGTVSTLIASYLKESAIKTGLFTSPFIVDIRECFWINGEIISKLLFVDYVEDLKSFLVEYSGEKLTYFELLTVLVLKYFCDEKVEYAVLEVGLGGRLDSTNVIDPELAILTTVEKEHTNILGDSLKEILNEKLGIAKDGRPFLIGYQSEEIHELIEAYFEDLLFLSGAVAQVFYLKNLVEFDVKKYDLDSFLVDFELKFLSLKGVEIGNKSLIHIYNVSLLLAAIFSLFHKVDEELFRKVVKEFKLIGRFDLREVQGKKVLFDMAHTKLSIDNLIDSIKHLYANKKLIFLVSILKDKDAKYILKKIKSVADKIVLVESHKSRSFSSEDLGAILKGSEVEFILKKSAQEVFEHLVDECRENELLIVTGSHFLISQLLQ